MAVYFSLKANLRESDVQKCLLTRGWQSLALACDTQTSALREERGDPGGSCPGSCLHSTYTVRGKAGLTYNGKFSNGAGVGGSTCQELCRNGPHSGSQDGGTVENGPLPGLKSQST